MRRRAFLVALATGTAVAGCLGDGSTPTPTDEESPDGLESPTPTTVDPDVTPTPTPPIETSTFTPSDSTSLAMGQPYTTTDRMTVSVGAPDVRAMIVHSGTVHTDIVSIEGAQFLVVDVAIAGSRTFVSDLGLALEVDGERSPVDGRYYFVHAPDRDGTQVAFPVPAEPDPTAVAVVWPREGDEDVTWSLREETHLSMLGRAPDFEVTAFEVPDAVGRNTAFRISYTVTNTGERDGRFLTEIGSNLISDHREYAIAVPAGETVTNTVTLEPHLPEGTESFEVVMNWGQEPLRRSVTVR